MNLLIISNTPHYYKKDGTLTGWGPTVRENDTLAGLFQQTLVLGFLHPEEAPASASPYRHPCIEFHPLNPSGGPGLGGKLSVLHRFPEYLFTIYREVGRLNAEDWIYVRCPCSLGLIACIYLILLRRPRRWFKYAGNWKPRAREALSYTIQRFILSKNLCAGKVTINGEWPGQQQHVLSFLNPCVFNSEVGNKTLEEKALSTPFEFFYAGRVEAAKGTGRLLKLARMLKSNGLAFVLRIAGDGPERAYWESQKQKMGLENCVFFVGSLNRTTIIEFYRKAHLFLFPTTASEGWPKVLSEAMIFGCVPVAGEISSIPMILSRFNSGIALPPQDMNLWQIEIQKLLQDSERWNHLRRSGMEAALNFTYEKMRQDIYNQVIHSP